MKLWQPPTLADLFDNNDSAELFGQAWKEVRNYFNNMGARCKITSSKLGFEISKPLPWLHLLYIYADNSSNISINEPCLLANIWVHKEHEKIREKFYGLSKLEYKQGIIYIEQSNNVAKWNEELVMILRFYISLDNVLADDIDIMRDHILNFSLAIFECCHTQIYHL